MTPKTDRQKEIDAVAETIMSMPLLIGPDNPKGLVEFAYALAEALVEQRDGPEAK